MAEISITEASLKSSLAERLKAIHVEVTDMSGARCPMLVPVQCALLTRVAGGCGQSFTSLIVSPEFVGKNSLKRHRLVNAALKDEIALIHAWSAKCQTPDEWEREKAATGGNDGPPLDGTVEGKVVGVKD